VRTAVLVLAAVAAGLGLGQNLIGNPGMEAPARDGLAHGWAKNCWGENDVVFSLDPDNPHEGRVSQKVECRSITSGAAQFLYPLTIKAGRRYVVSLWVRAEGRVPFIGGCLRHSPPPYTHHVPGQYEPSRQWEKFEFEGVPLESDDNAGLYIWFQPEGRGTIWVDEVSVLETEPAPPAGERPTRNVLRNGSFEVDPIRDWENEGVQFAALDEAEKAHGRRSLRFELEAGQGFKLDAPCLQFDSADQPFVLSCWGRKQGGGATLDLIVRSAVQIKGAKALLRLHSVLTDEWQRYQVKQKLPRSLNGAYTIEVRGQSKEGGKLWIDALSLAPAPDRQEWQPREAVEGSLVCDRAPANLYRRGEPVRLTLEVYNGGTTTATEFVWRIVDYREQEVHREPLALSVAPGAHVTKALAFQPQLLGAFRAEVLLEGQEHPVAEVCFGSLPPVSKVPAPDSCVGGHFSLASDFQLETAKFMGFKWTRIHDCSSITHWRTAEPERGKFVFFDDQVERARRNGLKILGEFLRTPEWASTAPEGADRTASGAAPPKDLSDFENYVATVVSHYKGRIDHWEIWNEPYGKGFFSGTPEQYAELARIAAKTTRKVNPRARVFAPSVSPHVPPWAKRALAAGCLDGANGFSFHAYGCYRKRPYDLISEWATTGAKRLPIWQTEAGVTSSCFYPDLPDKLLNSYTKSYRGLPIEQTVSDVLKLLALSLASGSEKFFYYWTNVEGRPLPRISAMSIFQYDLTVRPCGISFAIEAGAMDGAGPGGIHELENGITACVVRKPEEIIVVVWVSSRMDEREATLLKLPRGVVLRDPMWNVLARPTHGELAVPLAKAPVVLTGPVTTEGAILAALKAL